MKMLAPVKHVDGDFNLDGEKNIKFCQKARGRMFYESILGMLDLRLLEEDKKTALKDKLNEIPHQDKILIKDPTTQEWCISFRGWKLEDVHLIVFLFEIFLSCLTGCWDTSIEKILIYYRASNVGHPLSASLLYRRNVGANKSVYRYNRFGLNKNLIQNKDWEIVLRNLFKEQKLLLNYFYIFAENKKGGGYSEYYYVRLVDALALIAREMKVSSNEKYDKVIEKFASSLGEKENVFLDYIRNLLNKDGDDEKIGKKISDLRASIVHSPIPTSDESFFWREGFDIDLKNVIPLVLALELVIIDFIFQQLKLPQDALTVYRERRLRYIDPRLFT